MVKKRNGSGGRSRNRLTRNAKFPEMVKLDLDLDWHLYELKADAAEAAQFRD